MQFQSARNRNAGSYGAVGKSTADSAAKIFEVARKTGPDYAGLAKIGMATRSNERVAAMNAEAKVTNAGIDAYSQVDSTGKKVKVFNEKERIKNEFRKAGSLAAIGKIAGATVLAQDVGGKYPTRPDKTAIFDRYKQTTADIRAAEDQGYDAIESMRSGLAGKSDSNFRSIQDRSKANAPGAVPSGGALTSSAQAVTAGRGSAGSGGKHSVQQMQQLLENNGMSPGNAKVLAAVGMGESGGNAGIDTVQSGLDPNKSNEYSLGLFQINAQAHGSKLARRGWTAEDLRDPNKNAAIAVEVFNEAGGFTPWSVYNKGLHKPYLQ